MNKKYSKVFRICFFTILFFAVLNFAIHIYRTIQFNKLEREISPNSNECLFELKPRGGITDSWDKVDVEVDGKICTLTGVTYDGVFENNSDYNISDWSLRFNARTNCYINKAWCGEMEIHQIRNEKEFVQTLDLRNCTKDELKIEYLEIGQDLLFPLKNGDYIIYIPSNDADEFPKSAVNGITRNVTIGMIFYHLKDQNIITSDYSVRYKFKKDYFQGLEPKIFLSMIALLSLSLIVKFSANIAYRKATEEAEKLMNIQKIHDLEQLNKKIEESNSVIKAISEIYKILYKVNIDEDTYSCIRTRTKTERFLKKFTSAEEALKYLPRFAFVDENMEKIEDFYNPKTWKQRLRDSDVCSLDFIGIIGNGTGWVRTNLIVSTRNEKGEAVEVLIAIQDVDKEVKSEQERKKQLEIANKVMKSYNETLNEEIKMRMEHIKEIQQKVVIGLASVIGNRDSDTGGHVNRTSDIIKIIVDEIRNQNKDLIDEQKAADIVRAAPMHDLGKIYISPSILCKPAKLTVEEYEKMKEHSVNSGDIVNLILKDVEEEHFVETAFNVARFHHERWDGNGYPEKLVGEKIPLEARIMAVADVYDALVSRRCYKQPMSFGQAFEIMCDGMGSQFDPMMKSIFEACRYRLEAYYSQNA